MAAGTTLLWLRADLRLADNPALAFAAERGAVVPVFVWAPEEEGGWPPGAASRWWLDASLRELDRSLKTKGSRLIVARGPSADALARSAKECGADAVAWNRLSEPAARRRDAAVAADLEKRGLRPTSFNGALLREPDAVATGSGKPYQVFTPFARAHQALPPPSAVKPAPRTLSAPARWPASLGIDALELRPRLPWAAGIAEAWTPGEAGAQAALAAFIKENLGGYDEGRDRPDRTGTSRLSPHLHFGEIGPRQVWSAIDAGAGRHPADAASAKRFRTEILWREFAQHLLHHFPDTTDRPLRPAFEEFPWNKPDDGLKAWQRGRTGYPIVDAGMRELWRTGWMHNRVRMIVASFLVKDLRMHWLEGARWFWDTLVDADLANNTLGWQWAAGCGADAAPYFRIFNPVLQGERFDAEGGYVRRWVPELARLPDKWLHKPWQAPREVLEAAGVKLGQTYPAPIVDHGVAREEALAAFRRVSRAAR